VAKQFSGYATAASHH